MRLEIDDDTDDLPLSLAVTLPDSDGRFRWRWSGASGSPNGRGSAAPKSRTPAISRPRRGGISWTPSSVASRFCSATASAERRSRRHARLKPSRYIRRCGLRAASAAVAFARRSPGLRAASAALFALRELSRALGLRVIRTERVLDCLAADVNAALAAS